MYNFVKMNTGFFYRFYEGKGQILLALMYVDYESGSVPLTVVLNLKLSDKCFLFNLHHSSST